MKQIIILFTSIFLFAFTPPKDVTVKVVPNPAQDHISITGLKKPIKEVVIAHWITGLPIIDDVSGKVQEDITKLPSGNYYAVVTYTDNTWVAALFVKL